MRVVTQKFEIKRVVLSQQVVNIIYLGSEILKAQQALVNLVYTNKPVGLCRRFVEAVVMPVITESAHVLEATFALLDHSRVLENVLVF